ncbi:DUF4244 domain-containing protein [Streptacidiphilus sp. PB12-B1b]|uniref:DUF4244 domain-containing protein n=1 Tax=Streptacidiphilus sp. PB12-B1b TaxID=2705012 RepID=UPI0015FAA542|nr:DUF4244 domain-containing protein [Streptacidiphilus sp. PB12-B1b]
MSTTLVLKPSSRVLPFGAVLLRRARSVPLLVAAVAYAWLAHLGHLVRCRLARHPVDAGMTTAEYAVGTVAACGFAALLYKIVTSGAVSSAISDLITRALGAV